MTKYIEIHRTSANEYVVVNIAAKRLYQDNYYGVISRVDSDITMSLPGVVHQFSDEQLAAVIKGIKAYKEKEIAVKAPNTFKKFEELRRSDIMQQTQEREAFNVVVNGISSEFLRILSETNEIDFVEYVSETFLISQQHKAVMANYQNNIYRIDTELLGMNDFVELYDFNVSENLGNLLDVTNKDNFGTFDFTETFELIESWAGNRASAKTKKKKKS